MTPTEQKAHELALRGLEDFQVPKCGGCAAPGVRHYEYDNGYGRWRNREFCGSCGPRVIPASDARQLEAVELEIASLKARAKALRAAIRKAK